DSERPEQVGRTEQSAEPRPNNFGWRCYCAGSYRSVAFAQNDTISAHDSFSLFYASPFEEETRRFRNPPVEHEQKETGRQTGKPKDAPCKVGFKQGSQTTGKQISSSRSQPTMKHNEPPPFFGGH